MTKICFSIILLFFTFLSTSVYVCAESRVVEFPQNANDTMYSSIPFDLTISKLPPNYYGHDAKAIYEAIQNQEKNKKKGEFETTEEYQKRIVKETNMPILGSLSYDSLLAFYSDDLSSYDILYDTARSSFRINLRLGPVLKGFEFIENRRYITSRKSLSRDSYYATNAYNATVKVEKTSWISYDIELNNWREFPIENLGLGTHALQIYAMKAEISVGIEEAKKLKEGDRIKAIAICKLKSPFLTIGYWIEEPTINKPEDRSATSHCLNVELYEIWFYDINSGNILGKVKKTS